MNTKTVVEIKVEFDHEKHEAFVYFNNKLIFATPDTGLLVQDLIKLALEQNISCTEIKK